MNIENRLRQAITHACQELYAVEVDAGQVVINETLKDFEGDRTIVVFPLVKQVKKGPEQLGNELGEFLQTHVSEVKSFNVIKGFLNLTISPGFFLDHLATSAGKPYSPPVRSEKVLIEYSSPNTNKPLHLGHIRNNVLGYAVAGLLKATGYNVNTCNLVNDRGIHICKSMLAWKLFGNGETPASTGMKGDKLVGKFYVEFDKRYKAEIDKLMGHGMTKELAEKEAPLMLQAQEMLRKWEAGDKEVIDLWKKMNGWVYDGFEVTYTSLGVSFDKVYYESDTYLLGKTLVEDGLKKGIFFSKPDGSVWVDLTADGLDEKLLLRSDGTSVYITQDIGTAELKYGDFHMDRSLYVVGNEQDYHFKVLKLILKKMGRPHADGLYHLSYGMVDLPEGKMKSREGTVVDADDLIAEMIETAADETAKLGKIEGFTQVEAEELYQTIALGALKFFLLRVDPQKRILFDPKESIDLHGYTGPFIQYVYARIQSVIRRHQADGGTLVETNASIEVNAEELDLLKLLYKYPMLIEEAAAELDPSKLVEWTYHLAKAFNKFYAEHSILGGDAVTRQFRVVLSRQVGLTLKHAMKTVGIRMPERM